jgi:membrane protease YdiL (CAAX protease family)
MRRSIDALLLAAWLALPSFGVWIALVRSPGPIGAAIWFASKLAFFALPFAWRAWIEPGLPRLERAAKSGLIAGAASGLVFAAAIVAAWFAFARGWIDRERFHSIACENGLCDARVFAVVAVYFTLGNSFLEEYAWRWFAVAKLGELAGARATRVVSALAFTAHHAILLQVEFGPKIAVLGSLGVFSGALVWSHLLARHRSLLPSWLSHAIADAALMSIGAWLLFAR